jgi:hypothetical protein
VQTSSLKLDTDNELDPTLTRSKPDETEVDVITEELRAASDDRTADDR